MAAALTYRTIFGLVPLLMVSMLAFRLFGDMNTAADRLQQAAYGFFNYQVDASRPEAAAFKKMLDERVLDVVRSVSNLNFETIGTLGALLLIWAALGLLVSFENAANRIYRAPRGRGWLMRVGVYWSVLTLGPLLLLSVLYAAEFWLGLAEHAACRRPALRLPRRVRLARGQLPDARPPVQAAAEHARALAAGDRRRPRLGGALGRFEVGVRSLRQPRAAVPQALRRDRADPALPVLALRQLGDRPVRDGARLHAAGAARPGLRDPRHARCARSRAIRSGCCHSSRRSRAPRATASPRAARRSPRS